MKSSHSNHDRNLGKYGFDESTREFIRKIKYRPKPNEPPELHRQLKSYQGWNVEYKGIYKAGLLCGMLSRRFDGAPINQEDWACYDEYEIFYKDGTKERLKPNDNTNH